MGLVSDAEKRINVSPIHYGSRYFNYVVIFWTNATTGSQGAAAAEFDEPRTIGSFPESSL
jgi:hypothetical protein